MPLEAMNAYLLATDAGDRSHTGRLAAILNGAIESTDADDWDEEPVVEEADLWGCDA